MAANTSKFRKIIERQPASAGGGRGRRSELYRWLWTRADALERLIAEAQPSWPTIAAALRRLDVKDGAGKPPSPERCRKAWSAVRRAKGWANPAARQGTASAVSPSHPASPSIPARAREADDDDVPLRAGDGTVFNPERPT